MHSNRMVRPGISAVRDVNECNLLCKNPDPTGLESEAIHDFWYKTAKKSKSNITLRCYGQTLMWTDMYVCTKMYIHRHTWTYIDRHA